MSTSDDWKAATAEFTAEREKRLAEREVAYKLQSAVDEKLGVFFAALESVPFNEKAGEAWAKERQALETRIRGAQAPNAKTSQFTELGVGDKEELEDGLDILQHKYRAYAVHIQTTYFEDPHVRLVISNAFDPNDSIVAEIRQEADIEGVIPAAAKWISEFISNDSKALENVADAIKKIEAERSSVPKFAVPAKRSSSPTMGR